MNSRMKQLRVAAFMASALLLSTGLKAQTGSSGENGKTANYDPQPIAVYSVMPPCTPKTTAMATIPVPVANGNNAEELKTFTQDATKWAKENPTEMSEMVYSAQAEIEGKKILQRTISQSIRLVQQ